MANFNYANIIFKYDSYSRSGGPPQKILKNYMRFPAIWHIFLGSEWPRISFKIGPLQNKKTVAATISIHTRAHRPIPPTLPKTPRISATIKYKFNFKNIFFRHCIQCKKIKLTLPKIGGPPPLDPPCRNFFVMTTVGARLSSHFLGNFAWQDFVRVKKYRLVSTGNGQLSTRTRVVLLWATPLGLRLRPNLAAPGIIYLFFKIPPVVGLICL